MNRLGRFFLGSVVGVLGLATLFASTPPPDYLRVITFNNPDETEYSNNGTPDNSADDYSAVFLCVGDTAKVEVSLTNGASATLTATPLANTQPELNQKVLLPSEMRLQTLEIRVLGEVKLELVSPKGGGTALVKLIPEDVCKGFPVSLIADFEGTLQQTLPEPATLGRVLELRWRNNKLVTSLNLATCQPSPDNDKLLCLAGDETNPTFRLEGQIIGDTFTGTYKGREATTATQLNFEGTFNFVKRKGDDEKTLVF